MFLFIILKARFPKSAKSHYKSQISFSSVIYIILQKNFFFFVYFLKNEKIKIKITCFQKSKQTTGDQEINNKSNPYIQCNLEKFEPY